MTEQEFVLDIETTGLDPYKGDKIIEIAVLELRNKIPTNKKFHTYINPLRGVSASAYEIHGISDEFLKDKPVFADIADDLIDFIKDGSLIIHNAGFDMKFINHELRLINKPLISKNLIIDTLEMARRLFPGKPASLDALCKRFNISTSLRDLHGALIDVKLLAEVYTELTGGRQNSFILSSSMQQEKRVSGDVVINKKRYLKTKIVIPTIWEKEEHAKLKNKLSKALWDKM